MPDTLNYILVAEELVPKFTAKAFKTGRVKSSGVATIAIGDLVVFKPENRASRKLLELHPTNSGSVPQRPTK
jgi:hypothetical protein